MVRARLIAGATVLSLAMATSLAMTARAAAPAVRLSALSPQQTDDGTSLHGRGPLGSPGPTRPRGPFAFCPVDPPRHYRDDFGEPRYVGGYHRHEGIDIFAPLGTPIRAPFDGVAEVSDSWAGGLQLTLTGKRGFVFNAHLSRAGRTGKVRAGTVIGFVGNSGDARGGSTHDHFEWHPRGGPAVDSYRLLNAVCRPRR
jgi:peptidoglycan LD-endopeptidase LytH